MTKSAARRLRRRKLRARFAGASAAERNVPLTDNPYRTDDRLAHEWRVAYAIRLADICNRDETPLDITL